MTRCITIDQSVLEKTKMDKVLPRLVKRGDDMGKNFAQKILDNASEVTKQKATDGRFAQGQQSNGTSAKSSNEKARPPDSNESKSIKASDAKRTSSATGNKGATTSKPSSNSDDLQPSGKGEASVGTKSSSADGSNTKVKANHIIAKPSGFFSSLKSASKKPGTSSQLKDGKVK